MVGDKDSKAPYQAPGTLGRYLAGRAQQHGLITRAMGDAIAFCPPLIISEAEMTVLLKRFERALEDTERWGRCGEKRACVSRSFSVGQVRAV